MKAAQFLAILTACGVDFFAGVPDSTLASFCLTLESVVPPDRHVVAANEGAAIGLVAGYHLATGRMGCVYMQNSGLGNAANPLISLNAPEMYGIPALLVIGWRGDMRRNVQGEGRGDMHGDAQGDIQSADEPQHALQGRITLPLLDCLQIEYAVLGPQDEDPASVIAALVERGLVQSRPVALVVRPGVLDGSDRRPTPPVDGMLSREQALIAAVNALPDDAVLVATTGKVARELYEYRMVQGIDPRRDFLVLGAMGHASQIAAGVAMARPDRLVVCIDGDGALIMHMGGMTTAATVANLMHIVMNNGAHDSTGGVASRGFAIDMPALARACGYASAARAETEQQITVAIAAALAVRGAAFIEIRTAVGSRSDLSRPTGALGDAKRIFLQRLVQGVAS